MPDSGQLCKQKVTVLSQEVTTQIGIGQIEFDLMIAHYIKKGHQIQ